MTLICGVDPGAKGGLGVIHAESGRYIRSCRMPVIKVGKPLVDVMRVMDFLDNVEVVVVEDVHSMPGQGVASTFQFGRMLGMIDAVVMALELRLERVTPAVWKRYYGISRDKLSSLSKAHVLYPGRVDWNVKANDGVAEALLIANYWAERRRAHEPTAAGTPLGSQ